MNIKFFIYEIEGGDIFLALEDLPDNYETMVADQEIIYRGDQIAEGVKFGTGVDWFWNSEGFQADLDDDTNRWSFKYIDGGVIHG